jgi:O-antigen/teichoic acid export membrane protein
MTKKQSNKWGDQGMRSILRSTAVLTSSSFVVIVSGIISVKARALLLGPGGLGFMSILQSFMGIAAIIAGMGIATGVVTSGANALGRQDLAKITVLRRAAWSLFWILGGLALLTIVVLRETISLWLFGVSEHALSIVLIGLAVLFQLAYTLETGILNAHHRVGALAKVVMLNSLLGTLIGVGALWFWREQAIVLVVIAYPAIGWAISHYFLRREIDQPTHRPTFQQTLDAARPLLRFGAPYMASTLASSGAQLLLPVIVLHTLGTKGAGFYGAAATIALGYVGFILNAMAQDYYPRVSAASHQPAILVHLINQQHQVVMMLGIPMVLGIMALARYIVPLIYSYEFYPAVELLEWQLIADLLKFSAWTMSFVILARNGSLTFFSTELVGGLAVLFGSWLGLRWFGLTGVGIASLVASVVYYLMVCIIVRRDIGLVWTTENKRMILGALLAALIIRLLPFLGLESFRTPVALIFALLAGATSVHFLRRELTGVKRTETSSG